MDDKFNKQMVWLRVHSKNLVFQNLWEGVKFVRFGVAKSEFYKKFILHLFFFMQHVTDNKIL